MNKYEKFSLMLFIMGCFSWHESPGVIEAAMLIIGGLIFLNTGNQRPTPDAADLPKPPRCPECWAPEGYPHNPGCSANPANR